MRYISHLLLIATFTCSTDSVDFVWRHFQVFPDLARLFRRNIKTIWCLKVDERQLAFACTPRCDELAGQPGKVTVLDHGAPTTSQIGKPKLWTYSRNHGYFLGKHH
jgi:hypothetical protein